LVVRVRVRLKRSGKTVELRVLANGGAEGPKPCMVATTGGGLKYTVEEPRFRVCEIMYG
jgi:hypothetical protein